MRSITTTGERVVIDATRLFLGRELTFKEYQDLWKK